MAKSTVQDKAVVFLRGQLVNLRPLELDDAATCQRWFNDPETRRWIAMDNPVSLIAEREFITNSVTVDSLVLGIVAAKSGQLVGAVGIHRIHPRDRHAELGITIGGNADRGRGYGREAMELLMSHAFGTMNLNRIYLNVFAFNARAIRLYEWMGFTQEGVLREHVFKNGAYSDLITFGMLRSEFVNRDAAVVRGNRAKSSRLKSTTRSR